MVYRVPFSEYHILIECPKYWQNFVEVVAVDEDYTIRNKQLDDTLALYHGKIIDSEEEPEDIEALEFETEEDFEFFKLKWALCG